MSQIVSNEMIKITFSQRIKYSQGIIGICRSIFNKIFDKGLTAQLAHVALASLGILTLDRVPKKISIKYPKLGEV
jgi:hypothetical protein